MRSLIKWSPISDFHDVTNQLSNLMNLGNRSYYIDLEVPGVEKEDIQINYENGVITVNGERKRFREHQKDKIHKAEFVAGKFSRNFKVPREVESNAINALFENGILEVSVPKAESSKPKKVKIEVK